MALEQIDLSEAVAAVKAGGVIAFPTDTFYALGVDAMNESAIRKAFAIKRRPPTTPMPVLVSEPYQVERLSKSFGGSSRVLAERFWPGALTVVVPAAGDVPDVLTGGLNTVGLRMPNHELGLRLISDAGCGLTGTSANISGDPPTKDWQAVAHAIGDELDAIVIGKCGDASAASTVIQMVDGEARILREGPVSYGQIESVLRQQR